MNLYKIEMFCITVNDPNKAAKENNFKHFL